MTMSQYRSGKRDDRSKTSKPGEPLVSIITVVYNGAKTIEQTIVSVLNQSYKNIEYIIIDGRSSDGTTDIIKKYEKKIDLWLCESDEGIYDAMNKGIELSKGDLIGIINANDWYEQDIISHIVDKYKESDHRTVIYGLIRNFKNGEFYSIKGNTINTLRHDMIQHPTCFIPKGIYKKYGIYNSKYKYSADYDLILRFVRSGVEFKFIERIIANFRTGGGSSTSRADKEKYLILKRHGVISGTESILRIVLLYCTIFVKTILRSRRYDKIYPYSF